MITLPVETVIKKYPNEEVLRVFIGDKPIAILSKRGDQWINMWDMHEYGQTTEEAVDKVLLALGYRRKHGTEE